MVHHGARAREPDWVEIRLGVGRDAGLDVPPEIGLGRKTGASRNRFESSFDLAFHERVRAGFLQLARQEPARFRVVDSSRHIDHVSPDVIAAALSILG